MLVRLMSVVTLIIRILDKSMFTIRVKNMYFGQAISNQLFGVFTIVYLRYFIVTDILYTI
jgi:hypothetical protein